MGGGVGGEKEAAKAAAAEREARERGGGLQEWVFKEGRGSLG